MTDPNSLHEHRRDEETASQEPEPVKRPALEGVPSNEVYARVGDVILQAARDGVRRNLPAKDIVREIREEHQVHLSVGELRLLLASRRIPTAHHNGQAGGSARPAELPAIGSENQSS